VTTTIFARRYPRDVYNFACDSLPMLLFGLHSAGATDLLARHRKFLAAQVDLYVERILDRETGLVKQATYFSAPRDCMTGSSTVFANTMLALLERLLDEQDVLPNRLRGLNLPQRLRETFWCGDYFRDALDRDLPSGDANVWPFFYGIMTDPEMKRTALVSLDRLGFTTPIPLRYFQRRLPQSELLIPRIFAPNYQGDTSWMQMAPVYVGLLRDVDSERFLAHRQALAATVERPPLPGPSKSLLRRPGHVVGRASARYPLAQIIAIAQHRHLADQRVESTTDGRPRSCPPHVGRVNREARIDGRPAALNVRPPARDASIAFKEPQPISRRASSQPSATMPPRIS
jgi:hypothetical protein